MEMIKRLAEKSLSSLKHIYEHIRELDNTLFRIEEIDLSSQAVIFYCQGVNTVLKMPIPEAISDDAIISNLRPTQACWLGYYYGKIARDIPSLTKRNVSDFLLCFSQGQFKILSQDRKGDITYIDTKTKEIYTENPIELSKNEFVISRFDPSQACYIGIIAGINISRVGESVFSKRKIHPILKVVK